MATFYTLRSPVTHFFFHSFLLKRDAKYAFYFFTYFSSLICLLHKAESRMKNWFLEEKHVFLTLIFFSIPFPLLGLWNFCKKLKNTCSIIKMCVFLNWCHISDNFFLHFLLHFPDIIFTHESSWPCVVSHYLLSWC